MLTFSALLYIALTTLAVGVLLWFLLRPGVPAHTVWGFAVTAPLFFTLCVMLLSQERARAAITPTDMLPTAAEILTEGQSYTLPLSHIEAACLKRAVDLKSDVNIVLRNAEPIPLRADSQVYGELPSDAAVDAWGVLGTLQCPNFKTLTKKQEDTEAQRLP